jgi:hypothetical protein
MFSQDKLRKEKRKGRGSSKPFEILKILAVHAVLMSRQVRAEVGLG